MKFLLAKSPDIIQRCLKQYGLTAIENTFYCHPRQLEAMVHDFISQETEQDQGMYITYNIPALNLIPEDMVLWLEEIPDTSLEPFDNNIVIRPFWEVFRTWRPLGTGDVFEIVCWNLNYDNAKENLPSKKLLQKGEIQYFVPEIESPVLTSLKEMLQDESCPCRELVEEMVKNMEDGKN